jgi:hypothetical protein
MKLRDLIIVLLALSSLAAIWGGNWTSPIGTMAYGPPTQAQAIMFPTETSLANVGPGTCAYITPAGTDQACEGKIACNLAAGLVCLVTEAP